MKTGHTRTEKNTHNGKLRCESGIFHYHNNEGRMLRRPTPAIQETTAFYELLNDQVIGRIGNQSSQE